MKEVIPQFTYEDSTLTFSILSDDNPEDWKIAHIDAMLEQLDALPNVDISEISTGQVIQADVSRFLKKGIYKPDTYDNLESLLAPISRLLPYKSTIDVGLSLPIISNKGIVVDIHPSFQTWMQTKKLDREIATKASKSIGTIFGLNPTKQSMTHWDIAALVDVIDFDVTIIGEDADTIIEKTSLVAFNVPFLQTLGNCACLGSNASERRIYIQGDYSDIYSLESHNIDNLRQTLSLILGLGSLAAHMPRSFDETALYKDIEWRERSFPKNWKN